MDSEIALNARDLLPAGDLRYHHSMGSLTTPPYTENLNWFVLDTPDQVGAEEIQQFPDVV